MFLSLSRLLALGLVSITKDGKLVVKCYTIHVTKATYNGKHIRIVDGCITIQLPTNLQHIALENFCDVRINLVIEIDPARSRDERVMAMVGLSSAPAPVRSQEHCVPIAGANGDGTFTVTVCVSATDEKHLSKLTDKVSKMGALARCATIVVNSANIKDTGDGRYSLMLENGDVLKFTFHDVIAKEAMNLLQTAQNDADCAVGRARIEKITQDGLVAMMKDSRPTEAPVCTSYSEPVASTDDSAYSVFDSRQVASPVPTRDGCVTRYIWVDEAYEVDDTPLHREIEANAFSGIEIAPSKKKQKALDKAQRDAEKARHAEEEAQRLKKEQLKQEADEARRQKDLKDMARVEKERTEANNKAAEAQVQHNALVQEFQEFQSLNPLALIAAGLKTLEQWLENPETWRNQIATITTNAVQPVAQEEAVQPPIWGKTPRKDVAKKLQALAQKHGLSLSVGTEQYTNGLMYFIDVSALLATGILTLRVSAWGNEIVVGQPTDDGTHQWGTCVNVDHGSYSEIVTMFPEMDNTACQVMDTRTALKVPKPHKYQHHQPVMWVPYPLVMFNQPSAYPPRA